ncbi:hypothetical protein GGX14DRAFT_388265 [Mycena pura]|uniref:Uncharacterized protein n=1 Tax=Mycena pura TaxID=153505 RepID=A0AAD6YL96_9AGAR|nr:hypothetical protein GGX14DRAFT_388265 [Mycena pura]
MTRLVTAKYNHRDMQGTRHEAAAPKQWLMASPGLCHIDDQSRLCPIQDHEAAQLAKTHDFVRWITRMTREGYAPSQEPYDSHQKDQNSGRDYLKRIFSII